MINHNHNAGERILDYDEFLEIVNENNTQDNLDESIETKVSNKYIQSLTNKKKKIENKKIKKKKSYQKRTSNIFDLNNFIVQDTSNVIKPKYQHVNIPIPVYKELDESFYQEEIDDNDCIRQLHKDLDEVIYIINYYCIIGRYI